MRNFQTKAVEKIKHFLCSVTFFNSAVCEIKWKNIVELERPQVTIWPMRIACWIPKATNTHSEYAIIIAFPQQQWLHESTLYGKIKSSWTHRNYALLRNHYTLFCKVCKFPRNYTQQHNQL
jgi:hypothetical protein